MSRVPRPSSRDHKPHYALERVGEQMTVWKRFEDVDAWKQARVLTKLVYEATMQRPFSRDFALLNQIRKASNSIMSNIAEGFERHHDPEFIYFARVAKASLAEVQSDLYTALDVKYLTSEQFQELMRQAKRTGRVTGGLIAYLKRRNRGTRDAERGTICNEIESAAPHDEG